MGLCLLVGLEEVQPCDCISLHPSAHGVCFRVWKASVVPILSDLCSDSSGRENYSHFTDGCWVTGFFGNSVNHTQLCSLSAPSIPSLLSFLLFISKRGLWSLNHSP